MWALIVRGVNQSQKRIANKKRSQSVICGASDRLIVEDTNVEVQECVRMWKSVSRHVDVCIQMWIAEPVILERTIRTKRHLKMWK